MGRLISLLLLVYVIGIGVQLAPTVQESWDRETAEQVFARVMDELPRAAAWPVRAFDSIRGRTSEPVTSTGEAY
jgi:hypothetical protein